MTNRSNQKTKVGIITFHFPYNCGAMLQCYALQTALERKGYEASVINYIPWYHRNRYTPFKNPFQFAMQRSAKAREEGKNTVKAWADGFGRAVYSWRRWKQIMPREKRFSQFMNKNLHLSPVYRTIDQLKKNPPAADAYVSGSDQLWNAHITEGKFDEAYFLRFGGKDVRRLSYAMGADFAEVAEPEKVLPSLLDQMDAISLRENKCWDPVRNSAPANVPMHICVDPTLLLPAEVYTAIEEKPENAPEKFILTYVMPNDSAFKVFGGARAMSEKTGLPVIDVNGNPLAINRKIEDNRICSPGEFLWYINHASYVFTNSFHGTVFSVIYHKQFMTIPHSAFGNRTSELLDKLNLSQRLAVSGPQAASRIENPVDYQAVDQRVEELRSNSLNYLWENLPAVK